MFLAAIFFTIKKAGISLLTASAMIVFPVSLSIFQWPQFTVALPISAICWGATGGITRAIGLWLHGDKVTWKQWLLSGVAGALVAAGTEGAHFPVITDIAQSNPQIQQYIVGAIGIVFFASPADFLGSILNRKGKG